MSSSLAATHPVRGLLRLGVRLPLVLYRVHLGRLLGERFLMLTHIGVRVASRIKRSWRSSITIAPLMRMSSLQAGVKSPTGFKMC